MPLPPLAASERRLARFAAVSAWACALAGLGSALAPRAVFRALSLGGAPTSSAGMRLFGALAGAGLLAVAVSCRRASLRPREERAAFHPLLAFLGAGALSSLAALFRSRGPLALQSELLPLEVASGLLLALFAAATWVFVSGAPGVNVGPVLTSGPLDKVPSGRIALGVKPASPSATSPAPAAAADDAGAKAPAGTAG